MATQGSEVLELLVQLRDEATANVKRLNDALDSTERKATRTGRAVNVLRGTLGRLSSVVFSLKGAFAGLGIGLLSRSFITAAATSENYRVRLVRLLGSVEEGNRLFDDMATYASQVAFEYEDIMGAATSLSGIMKGGVDEINQWIPLIGDLAAASGLSIQDTTSQIIRMYSAGAASADMFRERGVLAMLGFEAGVSYSASETRKRLLEAFDDPASKFRGAAQDLGTTWQGMLSMVSDAWFAFRNMVMESGVFDYLKAVLQVVLEYINQMRDTGAMEAAANRIGSVVVSMFDKIIRGAALVADSFRGWQMIWDILKVAFAAFSIGINQGLSVLYNAVGTFIDFLADRLEGFANILRTLDIAGFGDKMASGLERAASSLRSVSGTLTGVSDLAKENVDYWGEIAKDSAEHLGTVAQQESYYSKANTLLGQIKTKAEAFAAAAKGAGKAVRDSLVAEAPTAKYENQLKSQLSRSEAATKLALTQLDVYYKNNLVSLTEYYTRKEELARSDYNKQVAYLRELEKLEESPDKKLAIQDKIFAAEQNFNAEMIKLAEQRADAEKGVLAARLDIEAKLAELKARATEGAAGGIGAQHEAELASLDAKHAAEIQGLVDQKATMDQIEEAYRLQQLEKDRVFAEQRKEIQDLVSQHLQASLGYMQEAFTTAYELSGKKSKEFFAASKAVAVAQTLISTYEAAQKAFTSLAGIPYVGTALGIAAAAAAIAAGMARVASIRSQSLARGGEVLGYSPTKTSDNIQINATAKEWVHPVDAVQYYGKPFMTAIQKRLIPREAFSGMYLPNYTAAMASGRAQRTHYAAGGIVTPQDSGKGFGGGEKPTNIVNIMDPQVFQQYTASTPGQRNILNVLSDNVFEVRQMVLGDQ